MRRKNSRAECQAIDREYRDEFDEMDERMKRLDQQVKWLQMQKG